MKKSTLEALYNYFNGDDTIDLSIVRDEINAEWGRLNEKAQANRNAYDSAKEIAFAILSETPKTARDLYAASDKWPQGFTVAKLQYALLHYWNDAVSRSEDSPIVYSMK